MGSVDPPEPDSRSVITFDPVFAFLPRLVFLFASFRYGPRDFSGHWVPTRSSWRTTKQRSVWTRRTRCPGSRPTPRHRGPAADDSFAFLRRKKKLSKSGTAALDVFLDDDLGENHARLATASARLLKLLGRYSTSSSSTSSQPSFSLDPCRHVRKNWTIFSLFLFQSRMFQM